MRSYIDRIEALEGGSVSPLDIREESIAAYRELEPRIEAFVHVDFDAARRAARESERRWRARAPLSPIDGMPISIKYIIETAGLPTEMGSPLFAGWRSEREAAASSGWSCARLCS